MKWIQLLKTAPDPVRKSGSNATAQIIGDTLCINYWDRTAVTHRYFINTKNYEHGYVEMATMERHAGKLSTMVTGEKYWYCTSTLKEKIRFDKLDTEKIRKALKARSYDNTVFYLINHREESYDHKKRKKAEESKWKKINALQALVPEAPDMEEWIHNQLGSQDYAMFNKGMKMYRCTSCNEKFTEGVILQSNPEYTRIRNKYKIKCPCCGKPITVNRREGQRITVKTKCIALQNINEGLSVARHFDVEIWWNYERGRKIFIEEEVRLFMYRNHPRYIFQIYYEDGGFGPSNRANRRMSAGYMYPDAKAIENALAGTNYESWIRMFQQLAAAGTYIDYNRLMCVPNIAGMVEYLHKGGFQRLLKETVDRVGTWDCRYYGCLNYRGSDIGEVFLLKDRQKINRIRQNNGGCTMLHWMRWSERENQKISEECWQWLDELDIYPETLLNGYLGKIKKKMSIEQIMNYVKKQQKVSYPGKSPKQIIEQWNDYLSMCEREKKKLDDEMVYKPRELKRRHDELVDEINKREMIAQMKRDKKMAKERAKQLNDKFPGAEEVLKEIKPKLEYQSDDYMIIVPEHLLDIVSEGQALHHCAGASDRYFERIKSRETYICFLRKTAEPNLPYYTIEVEPSGTIRQHRGYLDEEPNIEAIKPFLKEWQKYIKTTMSKADKELAKKSKQLRQKNIEELTQAKNTRVLQGLLEDFMDADEIEESGLMAAV
ncbi:MAG: PcfJ domain-containing protein [Lachnospiraceae bacterium]|nr:PcfJ domain-containing protein [Lachnospiraceae bacterium]